MTVPHHRVVVVGAGFAGIGASVVLQREGVDHVVLERGADLGGTWRDNTYPGCRCDVPSHLYSFSFAPNPDWSETYASQAEIQAYLQRIAERFDVLARLRFGQELHAATWDGGSRRWRLSTSGGARTCDVLLLANGPLAEPAQPDLPGAHTFAGTSFHSARWPAALDLRGRRVAVIGTGESAVQFVPRIQPDVAHLTVFQRTPGWVLPHRNRTITDRERTLYRRVPIAQRAVRAGVYWSRELVGGALVHGRTGFIGRLARRHLETQVPDPALRARLTPDYAPGCKRLLPSDDWYPALQQPNVALVTEKIVGLAPGGVHTADGALHAADTIIYGTGFRVLDNPLYDRVAGTAGRSLAEHWAPTGPRAHLGTTVTGFPNLFLLAGPNTGIGHTSLLVMIEAQLRYVREALRTLDRLGARTVELRPTAARRWGEEIARRSRGSVWSAGGCASWYLDAEGRNGAIWPDHTFRYVRRTRRFDVEHYELAGP